ncbi:MAG: hypothetical protein HYZ45_14090, partial [Burkholderiales bacterium]|nr:hypothetical protein [Burkholderiales bacterium]
SLQFNTSDDQLVWQGDQTVWHLTGYQNGYFWGACAAAMFAEGDLNSDTPPTIQQNRIVGTVTAEGHVLINFVSGSRLRESVIVGYGNMVQGDGQWAFQMQMSTGMAGRQVLHWANMQQTRPGEASFLKLPGVQYSVPEILKGASYPTFEEASKKHSS